MRMSVMIALIVAALTGGAVAQTTETGVVKVTGMHCGACAATVEKTVKKIDGVTAVKASQPEAIATVTYDPVKTTLEAVAKAINTETPFKAEPTKTKKK